MAGRGGQASKQARRRGGRAERRSTLPGCEAAAGAAAFEGACVEDFGAFGKGALSVLQWMADAPFGQGKSQVKDLFRWKAAQHIGVAAARSVVAAHDENVLRMRDLAPTVMEEAREGVAGRGGVGVS